AAGSSPATRRSTPGGWRPRAWRSRADGCGSGPRPLQHLGQVVVAGEVDDDRRLVAHHPGVVASGHVEDVPGREHHLVAVVGGEGQAAGGHVAGVVQLAAVGPGFLLQHVRPAEAGLEGRPDDRGAPHPHDLHLAAVERPDLLRRRDALDLDHVPPFWFGTLWPGPRAGCLWRGWAGAGATKRSAGDRPGGEVAGP